LSEISNSLHFRIKIGDKEIEVNGSGNYVEHLLERLVPEFLEAPALTVPKAKAAALGKLPGVEQTDSGPIITSSNKAKLSHFEVVGLLLYASPEHTNYSKNLIKSAEESGFKVPVGSRLTMMKGRVVHLSGKRWKLSAEGEKWVEEEVLPKL
jgi:hypothetical protein